MHPTAVAVAPQRPCPHRPRRSSAPLFGFAFEAEAAPEAFLVLGFEGEEALFECFELAIDLVSRDHDLDLHALLDTPAKLVILHAHAEPRSIHGVIAEVERRGSGFHRTYYRVLLAPALHRLRYHSDSRIFQQQSVPDIAKVILAEQGIDEVRWQLVHPHLKREYCTCYQESSYDFLRRLWAEEGIFFWFEHDAERHTLVLADDRHASPFLAAAPRIVFKATSGGTATGFWVSRFDQTERLRATERMARDYCFKRPTYDQQHLATRQADNGAKAVYQLYQYPGRHKESAAGKPFNRHALTAHRLDATTAVGESNSIHLAAGHIFELHDHPDDNANIRHRLLRVRHSARQSAALEEEAPADGATTYRAEFTTQPAQLDYHPANPNPRPRIDGPQIAIVTGLPESISTATSTPGSRSGSPGTATANRTRPPHAGCASPRTGPAAPGGTWPSRASARRSWSNTWRATPTSRSSPGVPTTAPTARPMRCRSTRPA